GAGTIHAHASVCHDFVSPGWLGRGRPRGGAVLAAPRGPLQPGHGRKLPRRARRDHLEPDAGDRHLQRIARHPWRRGGLRQHARGPIPAIGIIARGYIVPNISITGEFSGFPEIGTTGSSRYGGKYYDFDMYGTVNFSDHLGAQAGYRSFDVLYKVNQDHGTMK